MAAGRAFRIVVASHGDLAAALLASAEMICGAIDDSVAVGLRPDDSPESYAELLRRAVGDDGRPVLLLVDLMGGTPYNMANLMCHRLQVTGPQIACVCGVNLGMLLEAATCLDSLDDDSVTGLVAAGQASVADATRRSERSGV
jgi:mannose/fructose-specific phosphotransferase system component IIA